nr:MAG: sel1 repeat family protein [Pseudomonadota bacterium]
MRIRLGRHGTVLSPILAERRKLSVTRISRLSRSLVGLALVAVLASASGAAVRGETFKSPEAAFEQAMAALRAGRVDRALPALEYAAGKGMFLAEFYLARVFADTRGPYTDHAKAYMLYQRLADQYADIDPDDDQRAPFVAKSFTALAGYLVRGVPELNVKPDPERAAEYLHHAATFFNDQDAQFELAKFYLQKEDDNPVSTKQALHWLSVLTEKGHAGAQAFLADLYWRGKFVDRSPIRAYALVTVAVENAPAHERIWIEDIHQNIFCGLPAAERENARGLIEFWRKQYGRAPVMDRYGFSRLQIGPVRTCSNGEIVRLPGQTLGVQTSSGESTDVSTSALKTTENPVPPAAPAVAQGDAGGFGMHEAGAVVSESEH